MCGRDRTPLEYQVDREESEEEEQVQQALLDGQESEEEDFDAEGDDGDVDTEEEEREDEDFERRAMMGNDRADEIIRHLDETGGREDPLGLGEHGL